MVIFSSRSSVSKEKLLNSWTDVIQFLSFVSECGNEE